MANSVARGGGSTINGVVYQLLWSLLHVARIKIHGTRQDDLDHQLPGEVLLVLEPRDGGGDLQLVSAGSRSIEQIKARSDGSAWSLRSVIEEVLPDLFLAAVNNDDVAAFRFVTESRMGTWKYVYNNFFRSLSGREATGSILDRLDNETALKFAHKRPKSGIPFFPEKCTERHLFLKIAEVIGERPAVKAIGLSKDELHEKA